MNIYPDSFERLIELFKAFPGVGRRSAERMAFALLKWPPEKSLQLGKAILDLHANVAECPECGNICEKGGLCRICADPSRDHCVICVVEDVAQLHSIEKCRIYNGVYHVLHGKIIPLEGADIENANLERLKRRVNSGNVKEIVMALSMDVEGQATAIYLADLFKASGVKITRIARGIPAGSDISFADSATVSAAISGRTQI